MRELRSCAASDLRSRVRLPRQCVDREGEIAHQTPLTTSLQETVGKSTKTEAAEQQFVTDNITSRVLQLFERRLKDDPEVSTTTVRALLEEQRKNDFGDDDAVLTELRKDINNDQ